MIQRGISLCVGIGWVVVAYKTGGITFVPISLIIFLPVACIWFSDDMSRHTSVPADSGGFAMWSSHYQQDDQKPSPSGLKMASWFILLFPIILYLLARS